MKAAFHTLGCKVNQYETETIAEQFRRLGYEVVDGSEPADVYVINTCTVTNLADRKSRQFIRRAHRLNPDALVAVTGCYAQMSPEDAAGIDGVGLVCGTDMKSHLAEMADDWLRERGLRGDQKEAEVLVKSYNELDSYEELGQIHSMEARTRAFIKIQEGCENFCTYCVIPFARGHIRSRRTEDIVQEVSGLVAQGYKEIVLTGINTAFYGLDFARSAGGQMPEGEGLENLIAALDALPGNFRIRLSSLEPTVINADEVRRLLKYPRLCRHLHLALQSGSDRILKEMNRRYDRGLFDEIVEVLRESDPLYGVSTDIIVGFPGETEEDFQGSLEAVRSSAFLKVHVFKYSMRDGTPAARRKDQIDGGLKAERSRRLIQAAEEVAHGFFERSVGDERTVLVERFPKDPITGEDQGMENQGDLTAADPGGRLVTGYTDNYIKTYLPGGPELFNRFVRVRLLRPWRDGMLAEVISMGDDVPEV